MMTASYRRPRRISRSTNLAQSSTIQRMGASARPEEAGVLPRPAHHALGRVHVAHGGSRRGAGHRGPAGVGEEVEHPDGPPGRADALHGEVPVGRLLGKEPVCLKFMGLMLK